MTTGRRSSPIPQLSCVGGTAQGRFAPKTVQCYNKGFNGLDVQWECKADMPIDYQFGEVRKYFLLYYFFLYLNLYIKMFHYRLKFHVKAMLFQMIHIF